MNVQLTPEEAMERGLWDKICDMKGWDPFVVKEGLMQSYEVFDLREDQAEELGLIPPRQESFSDHEQYLMEEASLHSRIGTLERELLGSADDMFDNVFNALVDRESYNTGYADKEYQQAQIRFLEAHLALLQRLAARIPEGADA